MWWTIPALRQAVKKLLVAGFKRVPLHVPHKHIWEFRAEKGEEEHGPNYFVRWCKHCDRAQFLKLNDEWGDEPPLNGFFFLSEHRKGTFRFRMQWCMEYTRHKVSEIICRRY